MSGFVVPLFKLRQALLSVKVHADSGDDVLGVVRLLPGEHLHVMATDRYTAAVAQVPITERLDDVADPIDLAVQDVDKVLAVFKMPTDKNQWEMASVHVDRHGQEVTFTDAGGLFEGQALTVQVWDSSLPDLRPLIVARLRSPLNIDGQDVGLGPRHAAKLVTAAKTYVYPAYLELRGHKAPAFLVLVGPDFAAVAMPARPSIDPDRDPADADPDLPETWRAGWGRSLDGIAEYVRRARTGTAVGDALADEILAHLASLGEQEPPAGAEVEDVDGEGGGGDD